MDLKVDCTMDHRDFRQDDGDDSMSYSQSYFTIEEDATTFTGSRSRSRSRSGEDDSGEHNLLTWRGDPLETMADWKVVVVSNLLQSYTYYVHRSALCFGSRSSKYFRKAMTKDSRKHGAINDSAIMPSTKVELDERDAKNFPIMLDFVYNSSDLGATEATVVTANSTMTSLTDAHSQADSRGPTDENINVDNAVSLRHLARVFEIDALMTAVNKFIQKSLSIETGPKYLFQASEYHDARLMESARQLCVDNFSRLDQSMLTRLPLQVFRVLVRSFESFKDDDEAVSLLLSEVVCRFLENNREHISSGLLLELTDGLIMPYISAEAAIGFTAIVKSLDVDDAKANWGELTKLCQRCARTVVREYGWNDFSVDGAVEEYLGYSISEHDELNCVDSLLFATSFASALTQAQADFEDVVSQQELMESMLNAVNRTVDTLEKGSERKERFLEAQSVAMEESRSKVSCLQDEVRQLKEKLRSQKELELEIESLKRQLHIQAEITSQLSSESTAETSRIGGYESTTPRSRTPPRAKTSQKKRNRHATPPRSSHKKPALHLSVAQSQDPAIRDLVSPSSALQGRAANPRNGNLTTLEEMRAISIA